MSITFIVANKSGNSEIAGEKYFTDTTVTITHDFSNSVTEHPVETGVSFSDHVQVKNNRFTLSGVFGAFTLNQYAGDNIGYGKDRVKDAYTFLTRLRNDREVFTLVSKYDVYENCVIESLSIPVNADSATSLYFDLNIVQIRVASTESVSLVKVENVIAPKKDDASGTSNGGKQNGNSVALEVTKYAFPSLFEGEAPSKLESPEDELALAHAKANTGSK